MNQTLKDAPKFEQCFVGFIEDERARFDAEICMERIVAWRHLPRRNTLCTNIFSPLFSFPFI